MLSEEEKKAVKYFYNLRSTIDESYMLFDEEINVKCGKETIKQITLVLNLITKLQKENEEKDNLINEIDKDIEKNIYLAESNYNIEELNNYARGMYDTYINMRKQYFEKLAKEKGE